MIGKALIIGYGNTLRGDDGVGPAAAAALGDAGDVGAEVVVCHQLVPELAERLAGVELAVFVDAAVSGQPGGIVVTLLECYSAGSSGLDHHVGPEALLALAGTLYGRSPDAFLVAVGAASMALGDGLSPAVAAALPEVVATVRGLVLEHRRIG